VDGAGGVVVVGKGVSIGEWERACGERSDVADALIGRVRLLTGTAADEVVVLIVGKTIFRLLSQ